MERPVDVLLLPEAGSADHETGPEAENRAIPVALRRPQKAANSRQRTLQIHSWLVVNCFGVQLWNRPADSPGLLWSLRMPQAAITSLAPGELSWPSFTGRGQPC
ncbi:hypothetical protein VTI74DRAFT_936 [Chaetomium olivicolor]